MKDVRLHLNWKPGQLTRGPLMGESMEASSIQLNHFQMLFNDGGGQVMLKGALLFEVLSRMPSTVLLVM